MKFKLEFNCDSTAFDSDYPAEIARILTELAEVVNKGKDDGKIQDHNGNIVGEWAITGY